MCVGGSSIRVCLLASARVLAYNRTPFSGFADSTPYMVCRLILLSITEVGTVLVWAYILAQNWDVYAPGFRILSHNEEYVESETEFDLNSKETAADACRMDTIEPVRYACLQAVCFFSLACIESPLSIRLTRGIVANPGYESIIFCPSCICCVVGPVFVICRVHVAANGLCALTHSAS